MGQKNPIVAGQLYFLTITVIDWINIFANPAYSLIVIDSLKYCQHHKGLQIYSWCIMSNHIHMIAAVENEEASLSDVIRDLKKFTSKTIVSEIMNGNESRKEWILNRLTYRSKMDNKIRNYKLWQAGSEAKEIHSNDFLQQKLDYIHNNPVTAMIVGNAEDYIFSSARDYAGQQGLLYILFAD